MPETIAARRTGHANKKRWVGLIYEKDLSREYIFALKAANK